MRKNSDSNVKFSFFGFLIFFATLSFTSTLSIVVYSIVEKQTDGNLVAIIFSVIATIIVGALICTLSDIYRRKAMVERPVKMILDATEKIASGDFSIKLKSF